jgi:thioredoxin-like negative regulator of GroEL
MLFVSSEDELNFENAVIALYFYASWMPQKQRMQKIISKIEDKFKILFFAIDVDQLPSLCKRFNVTSIPEIIVLKKFKEIKRIQGLVLTSAAMSAFQQIVRSNYE